MQLDLPPEILWEILHFLPLDSLFRCLRTSREWSRAASSDVFWKCIFESHVAGSVDSWHFRSQVRRWGAKHPHAPVESSSAEDLPQSSVWQRRVRDFAAAGANWDMRLRTPDVVFSSGSREKCLLRPNDLESILGLEEGSTKNGKQTDSSTLSRSRLDKPARLQMSVAAVGELGVGKSALGLFYLQGAGSFDDDYFRYHWWDGGLKEVHVEIGDSPMSRVVEVNFVDSSGQEEYRALRAAVLRGRSCYLLCYDITKRKSLEYLRDDTLPTLAAHALNHNCVFVGLKCDLEKQREVTPELVHQMFFSKEGRMVDLRKGAEYDVTPLWDEEWQRRDKENKQREAEGKPVISDDEPFMVDHGIPGLILFEVSTFSDAGRPGGVTTKDYQCTKSVETLFQFICERTARIGLMNARKQLRLGLFDRSKKKKKKKAGSGRGKKGKCSLM